MKQRILTHIHLKGYFEIRLSITTCLLNMTISLHTVLTADSHLAEWQLLLEEPTASRGNFLKSQMERERQQ
jgi:hypothetical protein